MVEIKISGATPLEALASLTAFGYRCMSNPEVSTAANRIYEAEQQAEEKKATSTLSHGPQQMAPAVEENPTPPPAPPSTAPTAPTSQSKDGSAAGVSPGSITPSDAATTKAPSLEEVRAAGIEAAHQYGNASVKTILGQFGVENMTSLAEKDRAAFLEALKGMGDGNA